MQISYSPKPYNRVDYFPLPNGHADVFLHRNETTETDEEGNIQYVAEEVYFQIEQSVTKETIEENFETYWENKGEIISTPTLPEPTEPEPSEIDILNNRIAELESTLDIMLGGEIIE